MEVQVTSLRFVKFQFLSVLFLERDGKAWNEVRVSVFLLAAVPRCDGSILSATHVVSVSAGGPHHQHYR